MPTYETASPVALVTGASSGIGKATVERLLVDGYLVYAAARREDRMQSLAARGAKVLAMDVTEDSTMVAGMDKIITDYGRIDVLVNNAGYGSYGAVEDVPLEEARRQFEVNVFGLARLSQLALPHMRRQRSGRIVNISSIGGKIYEPLGGWYHAAKFAVEGLSDCMRLELKSFGIDVIVVEPGSIKTEWGAIAADNLLKRSANSAYARLAQGHVPVLRSSIDKAGASAPEMIARTISAALKSRRPRARYAAGYGAKPILFMRKWAGDRLMDSLLLSMFKLLGK